jgi:hypothetical protein
LNRPPKLPVGSTIDRWEFEVEHTLPLMMGAATPNVALFSKNQSIAVEVKVQPILRAPIYPAA